MGTDIVNGPWGWTIPYDKMDSEMTAIFKSGGDQEDYEVFKASQKHNQGATVEDFITTCKEDFNSLKRSPVYGTVSKVIEPLL